MAYSAFMTGLHCVSSFQVCRSVDTVELDSRDLPGKSYGEDPHPQEGG